MATLSLWTHKSHQLFECISNKAHRYLVMQKERKRKYDFIVLENNLSGHVSLSPSKTKLLPTMRVISPQWCIYHGTFKVQAPLSMFLSSTWWRLSPISCCLPLLPTMEQDQKGVCVGGWSLKTARRVLQLRKANEKPLERPHGPSISPHAHQRKNHGYARISPPFRKDLFIISNTWINWQIID